jgi:peptide/nickel transport system ATP-binding protein
VTHALDDVSFEVRPGEVLGLAGESGSGKTVTGELIAALQAYDSGSIRFDGQELSTQTKEQRREFRRRVSMVFQDPYQSLNPRMTVLDSVIEPLRIHKLGSRREQEQDGLEVLDRVGLRPADHFANEYPHQLSGGERQRAAVARALITKPKLLIADEPTTMLDVSVRTGLLNLLRDITREQGLAMVFISHDFTTLEYLCDRIVIIYLGRVAEIGPASGVLQDGLHPYAQVLAAAIPVADPDAHRPRVLSTIDTGQPPRAGCLFEPRCPHRMGVCTTVIPRFEEARPARFVACHLYTHPANHDLSDDASERRRVTGANETESK